MAQITLALHVLMAVIWVGGMIFAVSFLRPALANLTTEERLKLWQRVLGRFLPTLMVVILVLLLSGYWWIGNVLGGFRNLNFSVNAMQGLGWIMVLVFLHVYFAPYRRFRKALATGDLALAGRKFGQIRRLVMFNTVLGVLVVLIAVGGSVWN